MQRPPRIVIHHQACIPRAVTTQDIMKAFFYSDVHDYRKSHSYKGSKHSCENIRGTSPLVCKVLTMSEANWRLSSGLPPHIIILLYGKKSTLACLYFFKPVVLGGTKPRLQQWFPCKLVLGELTLVENLHTGRLALALKWLNPSMRKGNSC